MYKVYDVPFILLAYLLAGFFIGMYIDSFFKMQVPVFTILFTITGLVGGIWATIKRLK